MASNVKKKSKPAKPPRKSRKDRGQTMYFEVIEALEKLAVGEVHQIIVPKGTEPSVYRNRVANSVRTFFSSERIFGSYVTDENKVALERKT